MILELIGIKRDGRELSAQQIEQLVGAMASGELADSQIAAFTMAVCINGMTSAETTALTTRMAQSGSTMAWDEDDLGGPVLDKHSTGGVGDKVSLLMAPIVAACGGFVPMLSGRGLGHTGGTLDKLSAIPGYDVEVPSDRFAGVVRKAGCAIVGASADLAPADRRCYAVRSATATVESIPLITASILSKKMAAGIRRLVVDVKYGSGAFMAGIDSARELARSLVTNAAGAGMETKALITDMDQPLGANVGNSLEVLEVAEILNGQAGDARLLAVTNACVAELLAMTGLADSVDDARGKASQALSSGRAAEVFARMVALLGGSSDLLERPAEILGTAARQVAVHPERDGVVEGIDVRGLGNLMIALGGNRAHPKARIDFRVGLARLAGIGDKVGPRDRPLAIAHVQDAEQEETALRALRSVYRIGAGGSCPEPVAELVG